MNILAELNTTGIVTPDDRLTPAQVADVHEYLKPQKLWLGGHWSAYARETNISTEEFMADPDYSCALACYPFSVAWLAPHLMQKAMMYTGLARDYFWGDAKLFVLNIFWSFPGGPLKPEIQEWHRDMCTFDEKQLAMIIYLSDVDADTAHCYRGEGDDPVAMTGPAGTFFIENCYGFHKGQKPKEKCRLMAVARYGISTPGYPSWKNG